MSCCPRCGYHLEEELGLERLRLHAGEIGIFVDAEDTVDVVGAARLTGLSEKTMRNMRSEMLHLSVVAGTGFVKNVSGGG